MSHYHYDHHPFPSDSEMYSIFSGKTVLAKGEDNNLSGKKRGKVFRENVESIAKEFILTDGGDYEFGRTRIRVSPAVWHGDVGSRVGKVVMASIGGFLFGSDAQLLADPLARKFVLEEKPDFLFVDGYPTIFLGWRLSHSAFESARAGFKEVLEAVQPRTVLFDHHGVRDLRFRERMQDFWGLRVQTAAEFLGLEDLFLEAWRREIWQGKEIDLKGYLELWENRVMSIIE